MEGENELSSYDDILHMHCMDCFKSMCSEQENCVITRCMYCTTYLHRCKVADHETICLMKQVSCPNVQNGCPIKVVKQEVAKHLATCPANVIHCGMEWNRYPLYSRERYTLTNIYNSQEGRIKQTREHWVPFSQINPPMISGQLDIELAISDQRKLAKERRKKMLIGKWKVSRRPPTNKVDSSRIERLANLIGPKMPAAKDDQDALCKQVNSFTTEGLCINGSNRNLSRGPLFVGNGEESNGVSYENVGNQSVIDTRSTAPIMSVEKAEKEKLAIGRERVGNAGNEEVLAKEHGDCEVDEIIFKKKREYRKELQEEANLEVRATAEASNESSVVNRDEKELNFIVCVQHEDFHTEKEAKLVQNPAEGVPQIPAHFHEHLRNTVTDDLGLNVIIETIPKFQKNYPMCSIPCDVDLRRDQYCSHFKNVHGDIHGGLNYWIQQRCPLAQYGCPYVRKRFRPGSKEGCLVFDHQIDNFGVVPNCERAENILAINSNGTFDLLCLPLELIERIAFFLDSYSVNQFSKTCRTAHDVCRNLLQRRGIVVLDWERGYYKDGSVLWKVRSKRWFFSSSFSFVSSWHFTDEPSMGQHLKSCPFFEKHSRKHKVGLPVADFRNIKLNSGWR